MNRVTLEFPNFQEFLRTCSPFISEQGMFLRTDQVQPVGSQVGFDVGLGADFPILRGSGEVIWIVEPDPDGIGAPGMALRYSETDDATERLIRKIAERHRERTGEVFALERPDAAPTALTADTAEAPAAEPKEPVEAAVEEAAPQDAAAEGEPEAAAEDVLSLPDAPVAPAVLPPGLEAAIGRVDAPKRGGRTAVWLALAAVVIAAVGYWQRDFLAEKLGGGSEAPASSAVEAPLESVDIEVQGPGSAESEEAGADAPAAVESEPAGPAPLVASAPPTRAPLTRIEDISWLAGEGSTLMMLRADGTFSTDGYEVESLGGATPRAILKISGVTSPYAAGTTEVGTAEVLRVRTGLHPSELHVVLDLASPDARVTSTEVDGVVLQVRVTTGTGSP